MKFPIEVLEEAKNKEKLFEILKHEVCTTCLGRQFGMLGHGLTNAERGSILIEFANNLAETKFKEPEVCSLCNNFFKDKINKVAADIVKKLEGIHFQTFLIGSIIPNEIASKQDELWEKIGIEDVESIKAEMNRELGKRVEKLTHTKFNLKNPDVTILADLKISTVRLQLRSLYIYGKYQKLARGIPQTKWICNRCNGKGCTFCKGEGKLYHTSVQEIIEKSLIKSSGSKGAAFHGSGREDVDARNLDWRPFVMEMLKPAKRSLDLKKIGKQINKSKKVKVKNLKLIEDGKHFIRNLKTEKIDKTYQAEIEFKKDIDRKKLKLIKEIVKEPILQKTPTRVMHRRADKFRKRRVKSVYYKQLGRRKLLVKVRTESGLYIKELISGDEGRTTPNISEILGNNVKKIKLDVVKIHTK